MSPTRRDALSTIGAGLATALAGCAGSASGGDSEPRERPDRPVEEYEIERVRNTDGAILVTEGDLPTATPSDDTTAGTETDPRGREGGPPPGRYTSEYVISQAEVEELTFGDAPEAEALEGYLSATDFTEQSVFLLTTAVGECYEIRVETVALARDGDPDTDFCRARLPADVACSTGDYDTVGLAIRLPVATDQSGGHSTGMSSSCHPAPPDGEPFEVTVTTVGGES
jgi:hypothetical protein